MSVTGEGLIKLEQDGTGTATQATLKITFNPTEAKALSGIEITTPPDKTDYYTGDKFDPDGMVVTTCNDDGSKEPVTDYTVSPEEMAADTTFVTVTYKQLPRTGHGKRQTCQQRGLEAGRTGKR